MKTQYNISNLLKTKPMNAGDCARIVIAHLNDEDGFLTNEDIISIRDGKKDNSKYYNELLDINQNTQSMTVNLYIKLLNYKILTMKIIDFTDAYVRALYQEDIIECVDWLEKENKKMKKSINVLKSNLRHVFVMNTLHAYLQKSGDTYALKKWDNYTLEDLKDIDIEDLRDFFKIGMLKRRVLMNSVLAYKELIIKACEKMGVDHYKNKIESMILDVEAEDSTLARDIIILHDHFTIKKGKYNGFLLKELEKPLEAVYGKEHESFLED